MSPIGFPNGLRLERLRKDHARDVFHSGETSVDEWLATKAWQQQKKHLSVTNVLVDEMGAIAGYYTLASAQAHFTELPANEAKRLPRRHLPVVVLAWLGVAEDQQGRRLGQSLLAHALRECYEAGKTLAFVGVIVDCLSDRAKAFYVRWNFQEVPEKPYRLYMSFARLEAIVEAN